MGRWAATFVTGLLLAAVLGAQQRQNTGSADAGDLEVFQVRPNFYVIGGAGANLSVKTGEEGGVLLRVPHRVTRPTSVSLLSKNCPHSPFATSSTRAPTRTTSAGTSESRR